MRFHKKTILMGLFFGSVVWILDSLLDHTLFYDEGTFLELLLTNIPPHELYIRTVIMIMFLVFSIILSHLLYKRIDALKKLRESEKKFSAIFENINVGIALHEIVTDENNEPVDFIFLDANSKYEELSQLHISDIKGKKVTEVIPNIEKSWIEKYGKVALTGESTTIVDHSEYLDKYWEIRAFSPKKNQFAIAMQDVTDRKKMEHEILITKQKLESLFESMTEMVVLHDLIMDEQGVPINYKITDCNKAFTSITGIKPENAINKLATEVYGVKEAPYLEKFSKVVLTGKSMDYEIYFQPMDKHFMVSVVNFRKGSFATISTDITDIKQVQKIISAKNEELENYLYIASHDLRSPLVNIQGFGMRIEENIQDLEQTADNLDLDEKTKTEFLEIIKDEIPNNLKYIFSGVSKMDNLIKGLLQISRTGRVKMEIKKINMNQLFKNILQTLDFQIKEAEATIIISDLSFCFGDINLLNQLFTNIIGNALKYRDKERKLNIEISTSINYGRIIYSIKDNGIGISKRHLSRIWDVFFRVNPKVNSDGEGIGLSIVKRIVNKHKGNIHVKSEKNIGSTFLVELNRARFKE